MIDDLLVELRVSEMSGLIEAAGGKVKEYKRGGAAGMLVVTDIERSNKDNRDVPVHPVLGEEWVRWVFYSSEEREPALVWASLSGEYWTLKKYLGDQDE